MALVYAARYPSKIHGLVLAGAPVDINAGESELSRVAHNVPTSVFKHLVELGDGRVRGSHLLQLWKHPPLEPEAIHGLLQVPDDISTPRSSQLITLFRDWCARPIDLPGTYYLQVVQWLYKDNQLATGRFAALGRPIDLSMVRRPIFLLAARDDEIVAPEQLLAARHLVGSNGHQIRTEIVPCNAPCPAPSADHGGCEWSASALRCLPGLHVPRRRNVLQPDKREPLGPQMPTVRRSDRAAGCWSPLLPFSAKERAPRGRTDTMREFTTAIC